MKQLCTLFTGQAGVQMASAVWELLCLEHGVSRNGFIDYEPSPQEHFELNSIFEEISPQEKFVPRTVIADLEPSVLGMLHYFHEKCNNKVKMLQVYMYRLL